jgi:hypothetical protein
MLRKYLILFCLFICQTNSAICQIKADAGKDIRYCLSNTINLDSFQLGGNPTAIGGVPPYKYIWSYTQKIGLKTYHASDYLVDTSVANPKFKEMANGAIFKLMVIDGNGDFDFDEVLVEGSGFAKNLSEKRISITKGQTATLYYSIGGGFKPYTYFWEPNYNISSQFVPNPKVWPDSSLRYYLTITDAIGCVSGLQDFVHIILYPTSVNEYSEMSKITEILPNPMIDKAILKFPILNKANSKLMFIDVLGRVSKSIDISYLTEIEILRTEFETGLYHLIILNEGEQYLSGKLLIN